MASGRAATWLALLAVAPALAGCVDDGGPDGDDPDGTDPCASPTPPSGCPGTEPPPDPTMTDAPQWALGDWWRYRVKAEGFPETTFRMVVMGDAFEGDGDVWVVGADRRDVALYHAIFSVNPVLGRVSKDTFSPYQEGAPIRMYEFPLHDGKTWSARFFSRDVAVTAAHRDDIPTPNGPQVGFRLEAQSGQGFAMLYDYVPDVRWFTTFRVVDEKGFELFKLELTDRGRGFAGPVWFLRGRDLTQPFPIVEDFAETREKSWSFNVDRQFDGIGYFLAAHTEGTAGRVRLVGPGNEERDVVTVTLTESRAPGNQKETTPDRGSWKVDMSFVGRGRGEAWVVGYDEYAATL